MSLGTGIAGRHGPVMGRDEWLTPPHILQSLGRFDLDPCASIVRPWSTADRHYTKDDDGLRQPWRGRVWCNPPYGKFTGAWLANMAAHGNGIALTFARTDTEMFFRYVWEAADAVLFLRGRLTFCNTAGEPAKHNSGGPSCLVAYGARNVSSLMVLGDQFGRLIVLK